MKKTLLFTAAFLAITAPARLSAQAIFALTNTNQLVIANSIGSPAAADGPFNISNLQAGTELLTLAYRPSDGLLHTIGYVRSTGIAQLYTIDVSYAATAVGKPFALPLGNDEAISMRFESTASTLAYITTGNGDSYSINTSTGAANNNGNVAGYFEGSNIGTTAFSNGEMLSFDGGTQTIFKTNGKARPTSIDLNGLSLSPNTQVAMDVFYEPSANAAYTYFTADNGSSATLYYADLHTGNVTDIGVLGNQGIRVRDIAIQRDAARTTGNTVYNNINAAIVAYPNPASTFTSVVLQDAARQPVTVYVTNMNGETLRTYSFAAGGNRLDMDVSNIPAGFYSLQISETGKNLQSLRILKTE